MTVTASTTHKQYAVDGKLTRAHTFSTVSELSDHAYRINQLSASMHHRVLTASYKKVFNHTKDFQQIRGFRVTPLQRDSSEQTDNLNINPLSRGIKLWLFSAQIFTLYRLFCSLESPQCTRSGLGSKGHWKNTFVSASRAMKDYLLDVE